MSRFPLVALLAALARRPVPRCAQDAAVVRAQAVDDRKAVIATVEPVHELVARARIGGTITRLSVKEGDQVATGDRIAVVADQKLVLQMQALASRIQAQQAERDQAQIDLGRAQELRRTGVASQSAARPSQDAPRCRRAQPCRRCTPTGRSSSSNRPKARCWRRAPGRVLKVPVPEGSVVLPGETIATIAAKHYILRLQLPERHARFIKAGDTILVGARGLAPARTGTRAPRQGRRWSIPRSIKAGSSPMSRSRGSAIISSASARGSTSRPARAPALVIPEGYVYRRFGVSYVKLKDGTEVVVQPGMPVEGGIEILAGLHARRRGGEAMKLGLSGIS